MGIGDLLGKAGFAAEKAKTGVRYTVNNISSEQTLKRKQKENKIAEILGRCEGEFKRIMLSERALAQERQRRHRPIGGQRTRIADAAIGLLMVQEATDELSGIETQKSLDHCVRLMDRASRKVQHLNPNAVFAETADVMPDNEDEDDEAAVDELVHFYTSTVDDAFVDHYLEGYSFDECYEMATESAPEADNLSRERAKAAKLPGDDILAGLSVGADRLNRQSEEGEKSSESAALKFRDSF